MMFKPPKYQAYFIWRIINTPNIAGWLDMG